MYNAIIEYIDFIKKTEKEVKEAEEVEEVKGNVFSVLYQKFSKWKSVNEKIIKTIIERN